MTKLTWQFSGNETSRTDVLACVEKGWHPLINTLIDDLFDLGWDGTVAQVKEKFGGLRFYIGAGSDEVYDKINEAENKSYSLCEECGQPGKVRHGGWLKTLCDVHNND